MFKPGMVCIFCDSRLGRKGNKTEYKETRRETRKCRAYEQILRQERKKEKNWGNKTESRNMRTRIQD